MLNVNGRDIASAIDGVTGQSTAIAKAIRNGDLKVSVLGDDLFERALGANSNELAIATGNKLYLRRSSNSVLTDTVHEGTHGLDYLNGYGLDMSKSRWQWEKRAFYYERQYQVASGVTPEFSTPNEMLVHIWGNYKNDIYHPDM